MASIFYRKDMIQPGLGYFYVCDLDIPAEAEAPLEWVFREMNAVDGTETCCRLKVRSMSVGDVVVHEGKAWECAPAGWEEVTNNPVDLAFLVGVHEVRKA